MPPPIISEPKSSIGVFEREPVGAVDDVAQPLVGGCPFVGRRGRRGEPALVDAAAVGAQGVEVLRVPA